MPESVANGNSAEKLFVVIDPTRDNHLALERVVLTAKFRDPVAHVHLYISVNVENIDTSAENEKLFKSFNWFNELVAPLQIAGISYSAEVSWSTDWYSAIMKAAERQQASLILLPLAREPRYHEMLISDSIWRLLRTALCPVLVMRSVESLQRKVILAAVNFQSDKPESLKLNEKIIERGHWYADKYDAELHVVNAYGSSLHYPDRSLLAKMTKVPGSNIHVKAGDSADVIAEVAKEVLADVAVIGVRRRYNRWRGDTSGRVIMRLESDILSIN